MSKESCASGVHNQFPTPLLSSDPKITFTLGNPETMKFIREEFVNLGCRASTLVLQRTALHLHKFYSVTFSFTFALEIGHTPCNLNAS